MVGDRAHDLADLTSVARIHNGGWWWTLEEDVRTRDRAPDWRAIKTILADDGSEPGE
jgi:hypothetical protein